MINEFCPKCGALKSVTSSTTEIIEKNDEGNVVRIVTVSFHCNDCHTFVRSEDNHIQIKQVNVK